MVKTTLPVLILNNIVLFPYNEIRIELDKDQDKELISLAMSYYNNHLIIINETEVIEHNIIGVIGYINIKIDLPNNKVRLVIKGLERVKIEEVNEEDNILICNATPCDEKIEDEIKEKAYSRNLVNKIDEYINLNSNLSNSILSEISNISSLSKLTDIFTVYLDLSYDEKLTYLREIKPYNRMKMLLNYINQDLKVIEIEDEINEKVNKNIEKEQKDYILQEKLKVIRDELGVADTDEEYDLLIKKANKLNANKNIKDRILKEIERLRKTPVISPEVVMIKSYIDEMLSLPWGIKTKDNSNLEKAKETMNKTHFGLDKIKEEIISYLALMQTASTENSPIICLVGPPGVGKTSLAKSIARALNRKYTKISVGGVSDEAEINGHRRAYVGSTSGKIIKGFKKAGSINPVFVIDEIDKMTKDIKGDPASSLLEVLDKEQNKRFVDNYIEEEFDISNAMFILTANYKEQIPYELLDRMEIIELSSYTEYEKENICKNYIIPKYMKNYNLSKYSIDIKDEAILKIIRSYTKEAGVRELERLISKILRIIIKDKSLNNEKKEYQIYAEDIEKYLGVEQYIYNKNKLEYLVGSVNAMSYNIFGGDILRIEVSYYHGKGNIITTGQLGDIFKESAQIALSYIKSNYKKFGIIYDLLENSDIHLHVPAGAIKKDGPSAGVAITTAIISAFTEKKVSTSVSMTGEITLHGDILKIGGLKEKIIGAKRANIKKIYLPADNIKDVSEIEDYIKEKIAFKYVKNYEEIYEDLL